MNAIRSRKFALLPIGLLLFFLVPNAASAYFTATFETEYNRGSYSSQEVYAGSNFQLVGGNLAKGTWSNWAYAASQGIHNARIAIQGGLVVSPYPNYDLRICIQAASRSGSTANPDLTKISGEDDGCSPWASQGGGWAGFITDGDGLDNWGGPAGSRPPTHFRIRIDTRPLPADAALPKTARFAVQTASMDANGKKFGLCPSNNVPDSGVYPNDPTRDAYVAKYTPEPVNLGALWGDLVSWSEWSGGWYSPGSQEIVADCIRVGIFSTVEQPPAEGVPQVGIQANRQNNAPAPRLNFAGVPQFATRDLPPPNVMYGAPAWSGWTSAVGGGGNEVEYGRAFLRYTPSASKRLDMRFCIRVSNVSNNNNAISRCTLWASDYPWSGSGSFSGWAPTTASNGSITTDPNWLQIGVETRPMAQSSKPNSYITAINLGISASEGGTNCVDAQAGPVRYTPLVGSGSAGGWSAWATDGNSDKPDCYNLSISQVSFQEIATPTANFTIKNAQGNQITQITRGQPVTLTWSSTNATSCAAIGNFSTGGATSGSVTVYPTESTTYGVNCDSGQLLAWKPTGAQSTYYNSSMSCNSQAVSNYQDSCTGTFTDASGKTCNTSGATCSISTRKSPSCDTGGTGAICRTGCDVTSQSYQCAAAGAAKSVNLTVTAPEALPDLTATMQPLQLVSYGVPVTLTGTVRNQTGATTQGVSTIPHVFYGCQYGPETCDAGYADIRLPVTTPSISAQGSYTRSVQYTFPQPQEGYTYRVKFCADKTQDDPPGYANEDGDAVNEQNENNNCSGWQEVVPSPVLSLSASPFIIKKDTTTAFNWSATNVEPGSCSVQPQNVSTYGSSSLNDGGQTSGQWQSNPIPSRGKWVLSCTDLAGNHVESTPIEVRIAPGFSEF